MKIFVRYLLLVILFVGSLASAIIHYMSLVQILPNLNPYADPFEPYELVGCRMNDKVINPAYRVELEKTLTLQHLYYTYIK